MLMGEEEIRTRNGSAELPAGSVIKSDRLFALAGLGAGEAAEAQANPAGAQRAHFEQLAAEEAGMFYSSRVKRNRETKESQQAQLEKVEQVASAKLLVEARLKGLISGAPPPLPPTRAGAAPAAAGAATSAASDAPWSHMTHGGATGKRARLAGGVPFVPASSPATGGHHAAPAPATASAPASTAPAAATEVSVARAASTHDAGLGSAAGVSAIAMMQAAARQSLGQAPQPPMPLPPPPPPGPGRE
tara:strand:+ start:1772 stop:2509 length:738 start_codon:yes stop_codon:yes gene_type:complete